MKQRRRLAIGCLALIWFLPTEMNWFYNPRLASTPVLFWIVDIARFVVLPALLVGWAMRRQLVTFAQLGVHGRIFRWRSEILLAAMLILVPALCVWMDEPLAHFVAGIAPRDPSRHYFSYTEMIPPRGPVSGFYRLLCVLYMAASAAIVEEVFYRGMLRISFGTGWLGSIAFVLVSSTLFGCGHLYGGLGHGLYALLYGLLFALIYVAIGNLWPLMLAHAIIDFVWLSTA